jgi:hypothetical protein
MSDPLLKRLGKSAQTSITFYYTFANTSSGFLITPEEVIVENENQALSIY